MTEIPPEAVEAAILVWLGRPASDDRQASAAERDTVRMLTAALPHIEQAIRADERRAVMEALNRATSLAERYGEAIVAISDALPNMNRVRAIIATLDPELEGHEDVVEGARFIAREFGHKEDRP